MITNEQATELETLIEQMDAMYDEVLILTKKKTNDILNKFKIGLINSLLERCNALIGDEYKPFGSFDVFDTDDLPTNSDVNMILAQYIKALEMFRCDNIVKKDYKYYYDLEDGSLRNASDPKASMRKK